MARTVDWAIQKAFLHAQRKATPPAAGTSKYQALLAIADSMQKLWASEPGIEWDSLYSKLSISTITATDSFTIPDTVRMISKSEIDPIQVVNGSTTKTYTLIRPNQLYAYKGSDVCAKIGSTLRFGSAFDAASPLIGATLYIPAILKVNDITSGSDLVQVDSAMWLAYMMAAEFDRQDIVKMGQYDNLLSLADQEMQHMKQANSGQQDGLILSTGWIAGESWV